MFILTGVSKLNDVKMKAYSHSNIAYYLINHIK